MARGARYERAADGAAASLAAAGAGDESVDDHRMEKETRG
jgi:hypothetical protein